ncbi:MAG: hypothetical protein WA821_05435 [Anaerolineales bacterium]
MKSTLGSPKFLVILSVLALAQFACNLGAQPTAAPTAQPVAQPTAQPAIATPQETPAGEPQATPTPPPPSATLSEHGTPEEAQAMLQKAIAHYNQVGRNQALADFNNRVAPFFDRDLYVACIDAHLVISANGGFPNVVATPGGPLTRSTWDAASTTSIGSVNYSYLNPVTGIAEPKTFYYEKVGSDVCGVGAYH